MKSRRPARVQLAEVVRELPRHAHDLSRRDVEDSQRWRLLEAMTEVVARRGYGESNVAQVIARASVSRKTFYQQFQDKEDCFLTAYDVLSARLVHALVSVGAGHPDGPKRRRAQVDAFLRALASDLLVARVFMVDVMGAGARALERRDAVNARFGAAVFGAAEPVRRAAIVGGINAVVSGALLRDEGAGLPMLLDPLCAFVERALRR